MKELFSKFLQELNGMKDESMHMEETAHLNWDTKIKIIVPL